MAFRNLLSLITVATVALILSANTESATALSILDSHGHHVSRHVLHDNIAKKRRSTAKRCKQRPTSTVGSTKAPEATPSSTSKPATTTKPSSGSGNSGGNGSDNGNSNSGGSGNSGSGSGSSGNSNSGPSDSGGLHRGLAWAVDNSWAPTIADKPKISWYHHWADPPVPEMGDIEYVPCFWGTKNQGKWNDRVAEMNKKQPQHILGFNEPDISSQANMSPEQAADVWMAQIHPWGKKGVKLISPQIAFSQDWLKSFISNIESRGGWVDGVALHWYGKHTDIESFKNYVTSAHQKFNKNIWVTELGITTASGANEGDVLNFMKQAIGFLESTGYVDRLAWFGDFAQGNPPDGFATGFNALFYGKDSLTSLGNYYGSSG